MATIAQLLEQVQVRDANRISFRASQTLFVGCTSRHRRVVRNENRKRDAVVEFTESSRRRLKRYCRESVVVYENMVTLTFPAELGFDGAVAKECLRVFIQALGRKFKHGVENWSVLWFMEFTKSGRIHFHLLTNFWIPKSWLSIKWSQIVYGKDDPKCSEISKTCTRIEKIRSSRWGISSYVNKYAAKKDQKVVPGGFGWSGRFWGVSGCRKTVAATTTATDVAIGASGGFGIEKEVLLLQDMLEDAVFNGHAKDVSKYKARFSVYFISNSATASKIMEQVSRIDRYLSAFEDRYCDNDRSDYADYPVFDPDPLDEHDLFGRDVVPVFWSLSSEELERNEQYQ